MFHYRKNQKRKDRTAKPDRCPFCPGGSHEPALHETKHHMIVPNYIPYDVWEMRRVTDHLMIIPKRHVRSLGELTDEEQLDHIQLMAEYETKGYNVYARGVASHQRTIEHQHTHLIKTSDKQAHVQINLEKPYLLIKF
ncbi:MAG TPA: HIT domain-containing protein [Candidatus Saccharimonadales bacterium]|nr:HIT domain-containing protein [Candidatus Saccharimonadales bacterium]